jgi:hypothetical protein
LFTSLLHGPLVTGFACDINVCKKKGKEQKLPYHKGEWSSLTLFFNLSALVCPSTPTPSPPLHKPNLFFLPDKIVFWLTRELRFWDHTRKDHAQTSRRFPPLCLGMGLFGG